MKLNCGSYKDYKDSSTEFFTKSSGKKKSLPLSKIGSLNKGAVNYQDGDNAFLVTINMQLMNLPEIDLQDEKAVKKRIEHYFQYMSKFDCRPTVAGLGMALNGTDRQTLQVIASDGVNKHTNKFSEGSKRAIKKCYNLMECMWENLMQHNKITPITGIFLGKNNFNYSDKTECVVSTNPDDNAVDVKSIKEKYAIDVEGKEI